jgi:hypothetical protein
VCSDERVSISTRDIVELLQDTNWRDTYRNKFGFQCADIPYGYFKNDIADIPWAQNVVDLVCIGSKDCATETGTLVIKLGDLGHEQWRTAMVQAGWYVERDRITLIQKPPWMRKKAFLTRSPDGVNPVHYWLVAHAKPRDYYQPSKPFGMVVLVVLAV